MSLIAELIKCRKESYSWASGWTGLMAEKKETTGRLEDHERRLIRIETLIEISQSRRRDLQKA